MYKKQHHAIIAYDEIQVQGSWPNDETVPFKIGRAMAVLWNAKGGRSYFKESDLFFLVTEMGYLILNSEALPLDNKDRAPNNQALSPKTKAIKAKL